VAVNPPLFWGDDSGRNLRAGSKLVCTAIRHFVSFVQIAKDFNQAIGSDAGLHVYPFGFILSDANNKGSLEVARHGGCRNK